MEENKVAILEGLLYLSGDEGITLKQIKASLGIKIDDVRALIELLKDQLENDENRGLLIKKLDNTYKFVTKPAHKEYYESLVENQDKAKLSQAAVETLAIIAYNSPITRIEIEEIRGVNSDSMLRKLVAKDLIEEVGRSEGPGRPVLWGVTKTFMKHFGLESLKELPDMPKPTSDELDGENIFDTKYTEQ